MSEFVAPLADVETPPREAAHETGFWLDRFVAEWQTDRTLTTMQFCRRYPRLATDERMIAVIGYEEFCRRTESGEQIDATFLRQFPDGGAGLTALIGVHKYVGGHGSFLPGLLQLPSGLLDNLHEASRGDWPEPGETVAGFELLEVLGKGGFARVYLAEELALGRRQVALKVSTAATAEAHTLGKLRHPNVVPVHSVGFDAARKLTLICMPFLGRATLNDVLRRLFREGGRPRSGKQLLDALAQVEGAAGEHILASETPAAVDFRLARDSYVDAMVHLGAQLADALASTHRQNICHCDLKPSNVLLDRWGKPMLLDFHLSSADGQPVGQWGGTLHYVPPEVVKQVLDGARRPAAADPRSDLYSLAVVLYEMLCGQCPFDVTPRKSVTLDSLRELLKRQQEPLVPLGIRSPDVEPALAKLIAECLSFDLDARPATADQVAQRLRRLAARRGRWRRWAWRHRGALRAAQAAAFLGMVSAGYLLAARPPYAEREFHAARRAIAAGDYQLALTQLDSAETAGYAAGDISKLRGDVYLLQARQAFSAGDHRAARDRCTLALELEPASWRAYVLRARAHLRLGDTQAAWTDAQRADDIASLPQIISLYGDYFCACKKWESAIRAYLAAEEGGFTSAGLYNNLAHALAKSNRREKALVCLDRALQIEPLPAAYYQRTVISLSLAVDNRRELPDSAMNDAETAARLLSANYRAHLVAANIYAVRADKGGGESDGRDARHHLIESLRLGLRADEVPRSGPLAPIASAAAGSKEYQDALAQGALATRALPPGLVDSLENLP